MRNIIHVMHHLGLIDPSLRGKFEELIQTWKYRAPELIQNSWGDLARLLSSHSTDSKTGSLLVDLFNGGDWVHIDLLKDNMEAIFPSSMSRDEIKEFFHRHYWWMEPKEQEEAAEYCILNGVHEGWMNEEWHDVVNGEMFAIRWGFKIKA